jgi:hypothetical protein
MVGRPGIGLLLAAMMLLLGVCWSKEPVPMDVRLVRDSVVDPAALNLPNGPFGTCFNGQTFQQEGVVSCGGYQYAAYFADGGVLCVARRQLETSRWEGIRFEDYVIHHDDVHNVAVVGVCAADGSIHLSYDHHNSPFHYRRSVAGLGLRPDEIPWSAESFGQTTSALVPGQPLKLLTYPQFFSMPNGRLQLLYRLGASGDGDWYLAEYAPETGAWTVLGMLLSRAGQYKTSASRCAYPNPVRYGADGKLHITWCWRERPAEGIRDLRTNHDVCYAYSEDMGRTWHNNAGEVVAVLPGVAEGSKAISLDTAGIVVQTTRYLWGQMNTTTQAVDAKGRVHVINWQHDQDADAASADLNTWRYYHYWRAADGVWRENRLPFCGRKPQIVMDDRGVAYVINGQAADRRYHGQDHGSTLTIRAATEASGWTDWQTVWQAGFESVGEPLLDCRRWDEERVISVYTQQKPGKAAAPSALHVLDLATAKAARR